jgi:hypothetical protein
MFCTRDPLKYASEITETRFAGCNSVNGKDWQDRNTTGCHLSGVRRVWTHPSIHIHNSITALRQQSYHITTGMRYTVRRPAFNCPRHECMRINRGTAPHIRNRVIRWRWVVSFTHWPLYSRRKEASILLGQDIGWAPEPVRALWRGEKALVPARSRTPIPQSSSPLPSESTEDNYRLYLAGTTMNIGMYEYSTVPSLCNDTWSTAFFEIWWLNL